MLVLVILFALISLFLAIGFIRYHLAVKDVAQQIRLKRQTGSQNRSDSCCSCPQYFGADRGSRAALWGTR